MYKYFLFSNIDNFIYKFIFNYYTLYVIIKIKFLW